jgi:hypothetical protein
MDLARLDQPSQGLVKLPPGPSDALGQFASPNLTPELGDGGQDESVELGALGEFGELPWSRWGRSGQLGKGDRPDHAGVVGLEQGREVSDGRVGPGTQGKDHCVSLGLGETGFDDGDEVRRFY